MRGHSCSLVYVVPTWTRKVCKIMAFMVIIRGLGPFSTYVWGLGEIFPNKGHMCMNFPGEVLTAGSSSATFRRN